VLDWETAIRQRAIVYCGFDALTDPEIAAAVGRASWRIWSPMPVNYTSMAPAKTWPSGSAAGNLPASG